MKIDNGILSAQFDNSDMAFALGVTNFPEWRKNTERHTLMALPRIDDNPARPTFRIGHAYEYALRLELSKHMSRDGAGAMVVSLFSQMGDGACRRLNALADSDRTAIHFDGLESRYMGESSVKAPASNYLFVEYPAIAFDPEVLDRSSERLDTPLIWVLPSERDGTNGGCPRVDGPSIDIVQIMQRITEAHRRIQIDPNAVDPIQSVVVVNVTAILMEIDRRLSIRLHSKRLRGQV